MSFLEFQNQYKNLNSEQKSAVDEIEGPVMVIAGPGTGKTQILSLRIAQILRKTDTPPDAILALTFTESGVYSMRERLVKIIGSAGYRVNIFTFHGFCNEVIRNFPDFFPRVVGGTTVSEVDQIKIIESIIKNSKIKHLRPFGNPEYYVKPVLNAIKNLKRENISLSDFKKAVKKQETELSNQLVQKNEKGHSSDVKISEKKRELEKNKELLLVFEQYGKKLAEKSLYDYEDMILEVVLALEKNPELLSELQERYLYVLADEHQDANRAQNRILELLLSFHKSPNIFIVGDEKQAIFRFQGASLENFLYFKKLYPNALILTLEKNYRSYQSILDASHSLIEKNPVNDPMLRKRLKSGTKEKGVKSGPKIWFYEFSKPVFEETFVAFDIRNKIKNGIKPSSIGVFYRDNNDAFAIAKALEKQGVPFEIYSGQRLFLDENIRKLSALLKAVNFFGDENFLAEILFIDFLNLDHLDVFKILEYCRRNHMSLYDFLRSQTFIAKVAPNSRSEFTEFYEKMRKWSIQARNKNLVDFLEILMEESGYLKFILNQKNSWDELNKLETFFEQAKKLAQNHKDVRLSDFINYLETLKEYDVFLKIPESYGPEKQAVNLMTAHSAKGLEFDYVYIVGLSDGHWGGRRGRKNFSLPFDNLYLDIGLEDERRLFYVALTRAKTGISLSYSKEDPNQKHQLPSQFISEIDQNLLEKINPLPIENRFLKNAVLKKERRQPAEKSILKDRLYLKKLFFDQGLSVSALNNYLSCSWKYFFENLLRIPKAPSKTQMYGTAVHSALEEFFKKYRDDKKPSRKDLVSAFESALRRQPMDKGNFKETLEKGVKTLSAYYDFYEGDWPKRIMSEFKIAGVFLDDFPSVGKNQLALRGKLDKLEFLGNSDREVNVVDYKTSRPKSRNEILGNTKNSNGDIYRQLVFYKILLDNFDRGRYKMVSGEIDFIEPNDKAIFKKEKFFIGEEDKKELIGLIKKTAKEISSFSFWQKFCQDPNCQYCFLRKSMAMERAK